MSQQHSEPASQGLNEPGCYQAMFAPVDKFLVFLAKGWTFDGLIAEPIEGHHGYWSIILVRR